MRRAKILLPVLLALLLCACAPAETLPPTAQPQTASPAPGLRVAGAVWIPDGALVSARFSDYVTEEAALDLSQAELDEGAALLAAAPEAGEDAPRGGAFLGTRLRLEVRGRAGPARSRGPMNGASPRSPARVLARGRSDGHGGDPREIAARRAETRAGEAVAAVSLRASGAENRTWAWTLLDGTRLRARRGGRGLRRPLCHRKPGLPRGGGLLHLRLDAGALAPAVSFWAATLPIFHSRGTFRFRGKHI